MLQMAEEPEDQLYVKNPRIDRGRKVLLIRRGVIEALSDLVERSDRSPLRRAK